MAVNRDNARRFSARAKVAAAALLVAGVALAFVPAPQFLSSPASAADILDAINKPPPPPDTGAAKVDLDRERLTSIIWDKGLPPIDPPKPVEAPKPADQGRPVQNPTATPATPAVAWRYIGSVVGPRSTHALLERDGRQHLVRAGGEADGLKVLEVHESHVMVQDRAGPRRRIDLAAFNSEAFNANARTPATTVGGRAGLNNAQRMPPPVRPVPPQPQVQPEYIAPPPDMTDEERLKYEKYREEMGESDGSARARDGRDEALS